MQNSNSLSDNEVVIAHNAALERQALAQEAIDSQAICIAVGRDGRAHYGRGQLAADIRARKWTFLSRTTHAFIGG